MIHFGLDYSYFHAEFPPHRDACGKRRHRRAKRAKAQLRHAVARLVLSETSGIPHLVLHADLDGEAQEQQEAVRELIAARIADF